MPCRLFIKVREARGLPVMDKGSDSTDAYCEVKFASLPSQKTKIDPKTLNPVWKQSFKFEVQRDKHLQDAPVEFKVFDHDVVQDDIIGGVNVDITCLLPKRGPNSISGWFPLYDSIRGIRGSIHISIKVEFIDNSNEFRELSAGVKFYSISSAMPKYKIHSIIGFVQELIVEDDPEYQSFSSFSKARTTNEQRRNIFYHISGKLRRKIGIAVQDLGGNAVLGYRQQFDLEGESGKGIVARGYGTACFISRDISTDKIACVSDCSTPGSLEWPVSTSPVGPVSMIPPSGVNFTFSGQIHLFTLNSIPSGINVQLGGSVSVKAVKILKKTHRRRNRDKWWAAMRSEIRSHAKTLHCNSVFGYSECTTIEEDVVILSSHGTACRIIPDETERKERKSERKPTELTEEKPEKLEKPEKPTDKNEKRERKERTKEKKEKKRKKKTKRKCASIALHLPHGKSTMKGSRICRVCQKAAVGEVLLTTINPCAGISLSGEGTLIQARLCRKLKKKTDSKESMAIGISAMIPLLECDLYRQLLFKMKVLGANACFALQIQINLGSNMISAVATGTAVLVHGLPTSEVNLPPPTAPAFVHQYFNKREQLLQDKIFGEAVCPPLIDDLSIEESYSDGANASNEFFNTDNSNGEGGDEDDFLKLLDPPLPENMLFSTTQRPLGVSNHSVIDYQLILSFVRISWDPPAERINEQFAATFQHNYRKLIFELCNSMPCSLCGMQFQVSLPNENEIDFLVTGMAIREGNEPPADDFSLSSSVASNMDDNDDLIFPLDKPDKFDLKSTTGSLPDDTTKKLPRMPTPLRVSIEQMSANSLNSFGVESPSHETITVTNLEYIPGQKIKRYIGRISHHLIRETRENKDASQLPGRNRLGNLASVFLREAISVARAHVLGMGGDALIGFSIDSFSLVAAQVRTGYCIISFSGDAVLTRKSTLLRSITS